MAWTEKQKKAASVRAKARWAKKREIVPPTTTKREAHNAAWRKVRDEACKNPAFDTPPELLAKYMDAFKKPAHAPVADPVNHPSQAPVADPVNHPTHYTSHPSGIECIQITEHMGFNLGNALKYIWRCDLKHNSVEDLGKAVWYIQREIMKRMKEKINADAETRLQT